VLGYDSNLLYPPEVKVILQILHERSEKRTRMSQVALSPIQGRAGPRMTLPAGRPAARLLRVARHRVGDGRMLGIQVLTAPFLFSRPEPFDGSAP
jgi:hypothetical protein